MRFEHLSPMKKIKLIWILVLVGICFSCGNDDEMSQEQEAQNLKRMFSEIESLASSESCKDSSNWTFTSVGSKACGGPSGFIAYSLNIETDVFLEKINEHKIAQQEFNKKWGIISNCSLPPQPSRVECENGKAVLKY